MKCQMWIICHLAKSGLQRSRVVMHSRFAIVVMLIVALLGLAMHTAADMSHAANVAHGDCGGGTDSSTGDDAGDSGESIPHCCGAACHSWAPIQGTSGLFSLKRSHEGISTETARLASADGGGLRRPPRTILKQVS